MLNGIENSEVGQGFCEGKIEKPTGFPLKINTAFANHLRSIVRYQKQDASVLIELANTKLGNKHHLHVTDRLAAIAVLDGVSSLSHSVLR